MFNYRICIFWPLLIFFTYVFYKLGERIAGQIGSWLLPFVFWVIVFLVLWFGDLWFWVLLPWLAL